MLINMIFKKNFNTDFLVSTKTFDPPFHLIYDSIHKNCTATHLILFCLFLFLLIFVVNLIWLHDH